jgi:hypothetical protein
LQRVLSVIAIGEIKQIRCTRRYDVEITVTDPAQEHLFIRLMRKVLRRPTPRKTMPYTTWQYEDIGNPIYVVGTEDGPRLGTAEEWGG